ncbi:MAG: hypothetical protein O7F16_12095 [Acidobacteria bacterium]|nr:hypothetical protein [Acidobacteriota bacterium]
MSARLMLQRDCSAWSCGFRSGKLPASIAGVFLLAALLGSAPSHAAEQQRWFTAEFDLVFLTGDYGADETTDLLYAPLILKSQGRRYAFTFTFPFLVVEGPPGLLIGDGSVIPVDPENAGETVRRSGVGDLIMKGEYFFIAGDTSRRPWVSALGKLKIPTANEEEGLGTGELDWSVGVSYTQPFGSRFTGFLEVSRKQVGDPPTFDFDDTTAGLAGVSVRLGSKALAYLVYDRDDSIVPGLGVGESLNLGLNVFPDERWRLSVSFFGGLSETREDFGILLGAARTWNVTR